MDSNLPSQTAEALHIAHLHVHYGRVPVLWDVQCSIPQGHCVGVLGPNGAGKSTLIKAALGLVPTASGKVLFLGQPLPLVRRRVAYVPQRSAVDWDFPITVRDLVLMGRYGHLGMMRRPRASDHAAADQVLEATGLLPLAGRQIGELSGGQQQRAFLARALLQDADLYLMDEPFVGVDHGTERLLMRLLHQLRDQGKTLVIVHHDLGSVSTYFDWLVLLNTRLVAAGPLQEVLTLKNLELTFGKSAALLAETAILQAKSAEGISP